MNVVQQDTLKLLGAALKNEPVEMEPGTDWEAVYGEMRAQGVAALPVKLIRNMPMDAELKNAWNRTAMVNIACCLKLIHEETEIKKLFDGEQIPFAVLKGTASALYYPQPLLRSRSDIDLITCREDHERACECLEKNGYTRRESVNEETVRHISFTKNGITIELHRFFTSYFENEKCHFLQDLIEDGIHHAGLSEEGENGVPVLPDTVNGLILLCHIVRHIDGGIGLRQWLDFVMFAQVILTDDFWNMSFKPETEKLGYTQLAKVLTRTGQICLGLCKNAHWCGDVEDEVCEELIEFLLGAGDLGAKQEAQDFHIAVALNKGRGGLVNRFRYLQQSGINNWRALNRHPRLKPFAWIHRLGQYAIKAFRGGKPISRLMKGIRKSRKQVAFFGKLGLKTTSGQD